MRELRERHPLPAGRRGLPDADKLLAVVLHDAAALRGHAAAAEAEGSN
ncbi:hypothetical protein [Streptomyces sp. SID5910]|nr:hypothetical protein [Streptomyces sp. SID5910]MYR42395.1 hypothetical protein [Streptomyces sp. SID5910]